MTAAPHSKSAIHRFEVRPHERAGDPLGASIHRAIKGYGLECKGIRTARVYLVQARMNESDVERIRHRLLTDPVLETSIVGAAPVDHGDRIIEVHPLPGVMDPAAQTVKSVVRELIGVPEVEVMTGMRYDIAGVDQTEADQIARRLLANGVIEAVHFEPYTPATFPEAHPTNQTLRHIPILALGDAELIKLSREGHLFLTLTEMQAIQAHYRAMGREPTDIELETIAQTWSEHCVHKTLKSTVNYRSAPGITDAIKWKGRPGVTENPDGSITIRNLLKSTVAAATHELIREGIDWTLSVFVDNAGVIAFDDTWAVNVKVETHNRPSAIEPYGGAATGIGGCIRDVIGTGLGAKPIASTDVFCVAMPDLKEVPPGVLHPRRILTRVIDGVRDYGNRMGIPTVNGAVYFDDRYVGNPLVFCGCIGVMPRDKIKGAARPGDRIIVVGGRTGRDGIHGATFSSAELTHTHADEFAHAVQIGNAIEEKRLLDAILRARDAAGGCLYSGMTDCGAGGFSSAIGELGKDHGAEVHLDRAPLKYASLRYDEIWISESQERMILSVPESNLAAFRAICEEEAVEMADLGRFGTPNRDIVLHFQGKEVGRLSGAFLHDGIPMPTREAIWNPIASPDRVKNSDAPDIKSTLLNLLAHPNIASKRWIVRQYDHEVQGNTIIKPLVGPGGIGPGDGAVIQPVPGSEKGLAIACGLATAVGDPALGGDPYRMAIEAIDECVRNLVCVGADPSRIAILDNFCWPSCDKPRNMASLVRAAIGCYDAAKAYRTPFVSGKDSLNNQFRYTDAATGQEITIEIPPTLLITGIGIVPDVRRCITMDLKAVKDAPVVRFTPMNSEIRSSVEIARAISCMISEGLVLAAHDASEGGALVALAEMLIASGEHSTLGLEVDPAGLSRPDYFTEGPGCYLVQFHPGSLDRARRILDQHCGREATLVMAARTTESASFTDASGSWRASLPELRRAFLGTLDW